MSEEVGQRGEGMWVVPRKGRNWSEETNRLLGGLRLTTTLCY